jgi:mono/diheme cytochrome c family protein
MRKLLIAFALAAAPSVPAFGQDGDPVAAGQALYDEKCAVCHGAGLRNTGATFDLRELKQDERTRFDTAVLNGKGQMPPWRGVLSETHLDQLWAYIRDRAFE